MLKINFFNQKALKLLESALKLYNLYQLSPAAKSLFSNLVSIDYHADISRVLFHDDAGHTLAVTPYLDTWYLDLWIDYSEGDGTLTEVIESAIIAHNSKVAEELWDNYSRYLPLEFKIRMLGVLENYVVTDSFKTLKPFTDYEDQYFNNMILYRNTYDNCLLSRSSFKNSHITNCSFRFAHLDGVDFTGSVIENCDFTGARVSVTTKLADAILVGSKIPTLPKIGGHL